MRRVFRQWQRGRQINYGFSRPYRMDGRPDNKKDTTKTTKVFRVIPPLAHNYVVQGCVPEKASEGEGESEGERLRECTHWHFPPMPADLMRPLWQDARSHRWLCARAKDETP